MSKYFYELNEYQADVTKSAIDAKIKALNDMRRKLLDLANYDSFGFVDPLKSSETVSDIYDACESIQRTVRKLLDIHMVLHYGNTQNQ